MKEQVAPQEEEEEEEDIYTLLMDEFQERTSKLTAEEDSLQKDLSGLEAERGKSSVNEAKIAVLTREAEDLLAVNDVAGSESKMAEVEKIKRHQAEVINSISLKAERLKVIRVEKTRISDLVLNDLYPQIEAQSLEEDEAYIASKESILSDLYEFAEQTGASIMARHRDSLIPRPTGKSRRLRERFDEWFS